MYFSIIFKDTVPPSCRMIFRPTQFAHRSDQVPTVIKWIPTSLRLTAGLASTLQLHCENTHLGVKSRGQLGKHILWIHKILGLNLAHIFFHFICILYKFLKQQGEGQTWQTRIVKKYDLYHPWPIGYNVLNTNTLIQKKKKTFILELLPIKPCI